MIGADDLHNETSEAIGSLRTTRLVATWGALVLHARRIPLFILVNECPARQRSFNTAGLLAKYRPLHQPKSNLVATRCLLIARTI